LKIPNKNINIKFSVKWKFWSRDSPDKTIQSQKKKKEQDTNNGLQN